MATGINTYSNISSFVQTIFEDALFVARENNLAVGLVKTFNDQVNMAERKNQQYGTATMKQIGESDDLVGETFHPSALSTLTPYEYGDQFFLNDQRISSDPFGVQADASTELGAAMGESIDTKVFSNFSSLTGGTIGASGTAITWGHVFAMLARLRGQKAPLAGISLVMHPYQWHVLGKAVAPGATVTNAPQFQDSVLRNFYVGSVSGMNIFTSTNVPTSGTDAYAALFHPMAMAYDQRRAPRLEPERDASRRGWELNMTAIFAHGVWRPDWGIQAIFDNTAPTS